MIDTLCDRILDAACSPRTLTILITSAGVGVLLLLLIGVIRG